MTPRAMDLTSICRLLQLPIELRNQIYRYCLDERSGLASFEIRWPLLDVPDAPFQVLELEKMSRSLFYKARNTKLPHPDVSNHGLAFTYQQIFEEYKEEHRHQTGHNPFVSINVAYEGLRWESDTLYYGHGPNRPVEKRTAGWNSVPESDREGPRLSPPCEERLPYEATHVRLRIKVPENWPMGAVPIDFLNQFPNLQALDVIAQNHIATSKGRKFFVTKIVQECKIYLGQKENLKTVRLGFKGIDEVIILEREDTEVNRVWGRRWPGRGWSERRAESNLSEIEDAIAQCEREDRDVSNMANQFKLIEIKAMMAKNREIAGS